MNQFIRILLVDDNQRFVEAARDFLHLQNEFRVIGIASNGGEAVRESRRLEPDIILLDLNLGNESGLDLIPVFKATIPHAKIVVITIMQDELYRTAAMQSGADAFVRKTEMSKNLFPAILELTKPSMRNGENRHKMDTPQTG